jgi:hypothetical protein
MELPHRLPKEHALQWRELPLNYGALPSKSALRLPFWKCPSDWKPGMFVRKHYEGEAVKCNGNRPESEK